MTDFDLYTTRPRLNRRAALLGAAGLLALPSSVLAQATAPQPAEAFSSESSLSG